MDRAVPAWDKHSDRINVGRPAGQRRSTGSLAVCRDFRQGAVRSKGFGNYGPDAGRPFAAPRTDVQRAGRRGRARAGVRRDLCGVRLGASPHSGPCHRRFRLHSGAIDSLAPADGGDQASAPGEDGSGRARAGACDARPACPERRSETLDPADLRHPPRLVDACPPQHDLARRFRAARGAPFWHSAISGVHGRDRDRQRARPVDERADGVCAAHRSLGRRTRD